MPLLRKLADCLGILYSAPGRSPAIANSISPVADPELSFGWQGNLYTDSGVLTAQAANTIIASLTVVEDCFYTLDATVVIAGTVQYAGRVALEILDPAGGTAYRLTYGFVTSVITAVGATNTPPVEIYGLHLPRPLPLFLYLLPPSLLLGWALKPTPPPLTPPPQGRISCRDV